MATTQRHVFAEPGKREILGRKLELARLEKGLSQMEAMLKAGLIRSLGGGKYEGVTKGFLTYVEKGERGISPQQLKVLARLYNRPIGWFTSETALTKNEQVSLNRLRATVSRTAKARPIAKAPAGTKRVATRTKDKETPVVDMGRRQTAKTLRKTITSVVEVCHHSPAEEAILKKLAGYTETQKRWISAALDRVLEVVTSNNHTAR